MEIYASISEGNRTIALEPMYFQALHLRLIAVVKERVRSGAFTERSLARITGISQPHIHNVLKGARILSIEFADQILQRLKISVFDLLDPEELAGIEPGPLAEQLRYTEIPMLEGLLGSGHPLPVIESPVECYPFPAPLLRSLEDPVAVRLSSDPAMAPLFFANDVVLLDRSRLKRREIDPEGLYVTLFSGGAGIRWLRQHAQGLQLISQAGGNDPRRWDYISLVNRNILDIVKARVIWIGREVQHVSMGGKPTEEASPPH